MGLLRALCVTQWLRGDVICYKTALLLSVLSLLPLLPGSSLDL